MSVEMRRERRRNGCVKKSNMVKSRTEKWSDNLVCEFSTVYFNCRLARRQTGYLVFKKKIVLWYQLYSRASKIYKYVTQFQSLHKACKKTYPSWLIDDEVLSVSSTGNCFDDSGSVEQYANSTTFIIIYQQRLLTSTEMNHQGQIYWHTWSYLHFCYFCPTG